MLRNGSVLASRAVAELLGVGMRRSLTLSCMTARREPTDAAGRSETGGVTAGTAGDGHELGGAHTRAGRHSDGPELRARNSHGTNSAGTGSGGLARARAGTDSDGTGSDGHGFGRAGTGPAGTRTGWKSEGLGLGGAATRTGWDSDGYGRARTGTGTADSDGLRRTRARAASTRTFAH
ncbi:hypothetical protein GCM10023259_037410 [Thermocatellispora tengchongensis]